MTTANAGTPNIRELLRGILLRNTGMQLSAAVIDQTVNQMMYVIPTPQEPPTLEQMQELINLAYGLGWKDRRYAIWNTTPPTVTIAPRPDGTWLFLYDGKPRP